MQKIATRIFIVSSVAFGVVGILLVLSGPDRGESSSEVSIFLSRLLMAIVFVILPSFALSVAGKYLDGKK